MATQIARVDVRDVVQPSHDLLQTRRMLNPPE
jgi:hypothetical protein